MGHSLFGFRLVRNFKTSPSWRTPPGQHHPMQGLCLWKSFYQLMVSTFSKISEISCKMDCNEICFKNLHMSWLGQFSQPCKFSRKVNTIAGHRKVKINTGAPCLDSFYEIQKSKLVQLLENIAWGTTEPGH